MPLLPFNQLLSRTVAVLLLAFVSTALSPASTNAADDSEITVPNIVLIMADDMGFSDIGCYGGEIETPNIDSLAEQGIRFTQFYNTSRCCPTRATLLTGLYAHQAGIGHMMGDRKLPGYHGDLGKNCRTIAEVLKPAGYKTYMSGKWHVTPHVSPDGPKHNWPRQRGFDRFFGTIHGAGSFYDPNSLTRDNTQIAPDSEDFFYTDAIADNAITFIRDHHNESNETPFFIYIPFTCPHWPMHAREKNIAKYKGKYSIGWDKLRQQRFDKQKKLGLLGDECTMTDRDEAAPKWEDAEMKDWFERRMEVYAAMVDNMDQNIGRIIKSLKETGEYENTVIFFLADNGGCAEEYGSRGAIKPPRDAAIQLRPMKKGELQTRMQPLVTRDGRPVRTGKGVMPGPADTYVAYGLPWANASNTPFRRYKHWVHEGGISSPLVVHWPAGLDEKLHGKFVRDPSHLIDLMATCVDLSGADYPTKIGDQEITPLEGVSIRPTFTGLPINRKEPIFWEHEGNRAIRDGNWKLVAKGPRGAWELYDMSVDRSETNDLSQEHPDIVKKMASQWDDWSLRAKVKPWPWAKKK